jgi:hypothetical protein
LTYLKGLLFHQRAFAFLHDRFPSITKGCGVPCLDGREDVVTDMEYSGLGRIRIESAITSSPRCDHME